MVWAGNMFDHLILDRYSPSSFPCVSSIVLLRYIMSDSNFWGRNKCLKSTFAQTSDEAFPPANIFVQ